MIPKAFIGRPGRAAAVVACLGLALGASVARASDALVIGSGALRVSATEGAGAQAVLDLSSPTPLSGIPFLAETSFGSVSTVEEAEPGRYVARLSVPPTDMPRVALVVLSPQGRADADLAWRLVPVRVTTRLTAKTEPRATVVARVGSREFGPTEAARDGTFSLDIELSPGDESTQVHITDTAGNVTTSTLRVPVRPHDPLTVTLDRYRVTSDGAPPVRVFALAFDAAGRPLRDVALSASATAGEMSKFEDQGDGLHVARWTPPADGSAGITTIDVAMAHRGAGRNDAPRHEVEQISVVRGKPASLRLSADPGEITAGKGTLVSVVAEVRDSGGHALAGQPVRMLAERGELSETLDRGDGTYASTLTAPATVESGTLEIRAVLATGSPGSLPATLELTATPTVVPTSWRAFSLVTAKVSDANGVPVAGDLVLFHLARGEGRLTPIAVTLAEGQAFANFSADPTEEFVTIEATSTTVPSLKARVQIEKRSSGEFAIITRPAQVAQGGRAQASLVLEDDERVLQDSVLLGMRAGAPARLIARAEPSRLPADGQSTASLRADLTDDVGNAVIGETLAWAVDRGSVAAGSGDGEEGYDATFTSPDGVGSGSATVVVQHSASGLSASVPIGLDVGPARSLALTSDRTRMPADGASRAMLTATTRDGSGSPVRGLDVRFSVTGGEATIAPSAATGSAGTASAALVAGLEAGSVTVQAATADGLVATAVIELEPLGPTFLEVTAEPARIIADGQDRAEILVRLEDAVGQPLDGQVVELTSSSGIISQRTPRSDAMGVARAFLTGSVPGLATVTARSVTRSSLTDEVSVELIPAAPLDASFTAVLPACAGAVQLTASLQAPASGPSPQWSWDWTGDGAPDSAVASPLAPLPAGTQTVRLTVTDSFGRSATSAQDIVVLPAPSAAALASPTSVASGEPVRLDASGSSSADGSPLSFAWDLDDDGVTDATTPVIATWRRPDGRQSAHVTVTDAAGCSARATVNALFGRLPDLSIDVSVVGGASQVPAGDPIEYLIAWSNHGLSAAEGVRIFCDLANVAAVDPLPTGGTRVGPTGVEFRLGTIAAGDSGSFRVKAEASDAFAGTTAVASHRATIDSPAADADASDDADAAFVTVFRRIDLDVSISAPASAAPDTDLAAIVTLTNLSGATAPGTVLEIEWDADLLGSVSVDVPAAVQGSVASIAIGDLLAGATATVRLAGHVPSTFATADPTLTLRAAAWHSGIDPDQSNNSDSRPVAIPAQPDLRLDLVATPTPNPVGPGGIVEYRATYSNIGRAPSLGATIESTTSPSIVAGLADNQDRGVLSGDTITFDLGTVGPGTGGMKRWSVRLDGAIDPAITSLRNDGAIDDAGPGLDPTPANNVSSVSVPVDPGAPALDLVVTIPASARVGESVVATLVATNRGDQASGVVLVMSLATVTVRPGSANMAVNVASAGSPLVLEAAVGSMAPGQSVTWRQNLVIPCPQPAADADLAVQGSARIGAAPIAVAPPVTMRTTSPPDLALALSVPSSAQPGEAVSTTVTITNGGCAPCMGGSIAMTWPAGSATGSPAAIAVPRVDPGQSVTLPAGVVAIRPIQPAMLNVIPVTATVTCGDGDRDPSDDSAIELIAVGAAPDVAVSPPAVLATLAAGDSADVTVTVDNVGGSTAAANVVVSLSAVDASLVPLIVPSSVTLAAIPAGASIPVTFRVTAATPLSGAALVAQLAAGAALTGDADYANNSVAFGLPLSAGPDLAVLLSYQSSPGPPAAAATLTVTVDVRNNGDAPSLAPVLEFERDAAILQAIDPGQGASVLSIPLGQIDPGQAMRSVFQFRVVDPVPAGVAVTRIRATAIEPLDPDMSDNTRLEDIVLDVSAIVDVGVEIVLDAPPDLAAGGSVLATLRVTNGAPRAATGISVTAAWPAGLASAVNPTPAGAAVGAGTVTWSNVDVPALEPGRLFTFRLDLAPALPSVLNVLSVDATLGVDPVVNPQINFANDSDSAQVTATATAELCVSLAAATSPVPPEVGGTITYDVTVENRGTTAADPVMLDFQVDPRLVPVGPSVPASLGRMDVGASVRLATVFTIPPLGPTETTATFSATAAATAPQAGAPCLLLPQPVDVFVTSLSDLAIAIAFRSGSDPTPRRGTVLDYTLTVTNRGTQPAAIDRVTDRYPAETSVVSTSGPAPADSGGELTWMGLPLLMPGASLDLDVAVQVDAALAPGAYVLHHDTQVFNAGADGNAGNDRWTHDLPMTLEVDLEVVLVATPEPPAVPGSRIRYVATVTNRGAYPATNTHLDIDLGAFAVLDGASPGSGTGPIDVSLGQVDPGTSRTVTFDATSVPVMSAERTAVVVTAGARCDLVDPIPGNDSDSASTWVDASVDLDVHVACSTAGGGSLAAGGQLDCVATIHDHGSLIGAPVDVTVAYDAALASFQAGGPFSESAAGTLLATVVSVSPSSPASLAFSLTIANPLPAEQNAVSICATATCPFPDRFPSDNTRCVVPPVIAFARPDLVVTLDMTAPTSPAAPGQAADCTLVVRNTGTTDATGVTASVDRDPTTTSGLLAGASVPMSDDAVRTITVPIGSIAPGATFTATFQIGLLATMPAPTGTVAARACATLDQVDATPFDNCDDASLAYAAAVDAWVALESVSAVPVAAGQTLTLRLTSGNMGQAPARTAIVDVALSPLTDLSAGCSCTPVGPDTIRFTLGDVAPGTSSMTTFDVLVDAELPDAANTLRFTAAISHADPAQEAGPGPDSALLDVSATAAADLALTLTRLPPDPVPNGDLIYRAEWTNQGTTTARGVTLQVTDPAFATPTLFAPNALIPLPDVPVGAVGLQDLPYRVDATLPDTTNTLAATTVIATTTPEAGPGPNVASWSDIVTANPDLWTTLDVEPETPPLACCRTIVTSLGYGNIGQAGAAATLALEYDPAIVQVLDPVGATDSGDTLTWTFTSVPAGASQVLAPKFLSLCVLPGEVNPAFFSAAISTSPGLDPNPLNDSRQDLVVAAAAPDLTVGLRFVSATPNPATAGSVLAYEFEVWNIGCTRATNVQIEVRWEDPILVASGSCEGDPDCSATGNVLIWDLGTLPVWTGVPIRRSFSLTVASLLPAVVNQLTTTATATLLESDPNGGDNTMSAITTIVGTPDLRLALTTSPGGGSRIVPGTVVTHQYGISNVGNAPAESVVLAADFDDPTLSFLFASSGGSASGGTVSFPPIAAVAPGTTVTPVRSALFLANDLVPPPVRRTIPHSALVQEGPPFDLLRDANPADNSDSVDLIGCYLGVVIANSAIAPICMGGSASLNAKATPSAGVTYAWSVDGGTGTFTSTTTAWTTFTPPVTPAGATYRIRCRVIDTTSGCDREATIDVQTTTACVSCGCRPNPVKVRYDGQLSRTDRAGDRTVSEGETVAFRVQVAELNMSKTSTLLAGQTTLSFGRPGAGPQYVATLVADVYVECGGTHVLEFSPAVVPAGLAVGGVPTDYQAKFKWVTRDACGDVKTDNDDSGGDNITVTPPGIVGIDPGITFTDWGPLQRR